MVSLALFTRCATPVAPTGGEPDRTGPVLVGTYPENGTVNFTGQRIRFEFQDYVDRNSFRNALNIEPDINIPFEINWRRKTATISLNQALPDSTTLLFNLSTDLRDTRNNRISRPITLALSTGPDIDKGEISLTIKPFSPDIKLDNVSVLLYREPVDIDKSARYVGFPDTAGTVQFGYLSEGNYFAFIVHDINRNRRWEPQREFAQPLIVKNIVLTEDVPLELGTHYFARRDTIRPVLEGIGLLTSQRMRLRFSKPIRYRPSTTIGVQNIVTQENFRAGYLFNDSADENVALFHADYPLSEQDTFSISVSNLTDRAGNRVVSYTQTFEGNDAVDTLFVRYDAHLTEIGVREKDPVILAYSGFISNPMITDSLKFYVNRELKPEAIRVEQRYNLLYLHPSDRWSGTDSYNIGVWNPESGRHKTVDVKVLRESDFGDISVNVTDSVYVGEPMHVILYDSRNRIVDSHSFTDNTMLLSLLPGDYHLVIFHDPNEMGVWNSGKVSPFVKPASIYVNPRFPVRAGMSAEVEVSFNK